MEKVWKTNIGRNKGLNFLKLNEKYKPIVVISSMNKY
jgi:hypothetical protein